MAYVDAGFVLKFDEFLKEYKLSIHQSMENIASLDASYQRPSGEIGG